MSQHDDEMAVAEFIRAKGVTRCPTACANATQGILTSTDRAELKRYADAQEAVRLERLQYHHWKAAKASG
jgi:hypothetical protein